MGAVQKTATTSIISGRVSDTKEGAEGRAKSKERRNAKARREKSEKRRKKKGTGGRVLTTDKIGQARSRREGVQRGTSWEIAARRGSARAGAFGVSLSRASGGQSGGQSQLFGYDVEGARECFKLLPAVRCMHLGKGG